MYTKLDTYIDALRENGCGGPERVSLKVHGWKNLGKLLWKTVKKLVIGKDQTQIQAALALSPVFI